jgi:hypothetical protein
VICDVGAYHRGTEKKAEHEAPLAFQAALRGLTAAFYDYDIPQRHVLSRITETWRHEAWVNHENVLLHDGNAYQVEDVHYKFAAVQRFCDTLRSLFYRLTVSQL